LEVDFGIAYIKPTSRALEYVYTQQKNKVSSYMFRLSMSVILREPSQKLM
jgi:hypothetical protein